MDTAPNLTPVLGRYFTREWSHGIGHRLYDTDGKAYLDFANGIAVSALGHVHPRVTAAIHAQVDKLIGPVNALGFTEPISRLATDLAATFPAPLDSVMFLNSGSEVIDGALKLARRVTGRPGIVAFRGGFHGRTFGAMSVTTSNINYRTGYEPMLPGVYFAPYPAVYADFDGDEDRAVESCLAILDSLFATIIAPSMVGGLLIEPVQGEGGFIPAPAAFLEGLRERCDRHGILLIADEVQTGYARTGRMWAFEHAEIVPDVVVVAKAIANGLPLSAIVSSRELQERWGRGAHGSTYGGNPVACAAALATIDLLRGGLIDNTADVGGFLLDGLRALAGRQPLIREARGLGLMIGVEFADAETADAVEIECFQHGVLTLRAGDSTIRMSPPLVINREQAATGLRVFEDACAAVAGR